jgi:D-lactate dehydrogenase
MVPLETDDGYMFMTEGSELHRFLILEEGTLARTKLSVNSSTDKLNILESIQRSQQNVVSQLIAQHSVVIDTLEGRGRVTGLLHVVNRDPMHRAYATVTSRGPVKVWLVSGEDFRELVSSQPQFALDFMSCMSRELRSGTKSLRSLMETMGSGLRRTKRKNELRVLCYDATSWVVEGFKPVIEEFNNKASSFEITMDYTTERLGINSATHAVGYEAICTFVNDIADADVMQTLSRMGVKLIAQRAVGYDRIDTKAARAYGITVARVPDYSPYAVAEMAIALMMTVNRKITKAHNRVNMANFSLDKGLLGFDVHGKTVGVMGTGRIGQIICNILLGFGAKVLCYDLYPNEELKAKGCVYVTQDEMFSQVDVLFLMLPLVPTTKHIINKDMLHKLKKGVTIINTSRGGLVDTKALLQGINDGIIRGAGMDVYENESDYFFQDWSARHIDDPDLRALLGEHNVTLTAHQAFFTKEAVDRIISTTVQNLIDYKEGKHMLRHPNNCIPVISVVE